MRLGSALAFTWLLVGPPMLSAQRPCGPAAPLDSVFTIGPSTKAVWSDGLATYADGGGCYTVDFKVSNAAPEPGLTGTIRFEPARLPSVRAQ